jgi:hypothetical protein
MLLCHTTICCGDAQGQHQEWECLKATNILVSWARSSIPAQRKANGVRPSLADMVTVASVQYYLEGSLAATASASSWLAQITPATTGSHTLYAAATDSQGKSVNSVTNQFTAALAPNVAITNPASEVDGRAGGNFVSTVNSASGAAHGVSLVSVAH